MTRKSFIAVALWAFVASLLKLHSKPKPVLRAGPGIGLGYDEPSRRWYFEDCILCEGEFDAVACRAQLIAEGRYDEYTVIVAAPFREMPLWLDEYRTSVA